MSRSELVFLMHQFINREVYSIYNYFDITEKKVKISFPNLYKQLLRSHLEWKFESNIYSLNTSKDLKTIRKNYQWRSSSFNPNLRYNQYNRLFCFYNNVWHNLRDWVKTLIRNFKDFKRAWKILILVTHKELISLIGLDKSSYKHVYVTEVDYAKKE